MMWGDNSHSQCGVLSEETPIDAHPRPGDARRGRGRAAAGASPRAAAAVGCGEAHAVLTAEGDVYAFGDNGYGQCGNVTGHVTTEPLLVPLPLVGGELRPQSTRALLYLSPPRPAGCSPLVTTLTASWEYAPERLHAQLDAGAQAGVRELDEDAFETELAAASVEPIELHLGPGETLAACATFAFHWRRSPIVVGCSCRRTIPTASSGSRQPARVTSAPLTAPCP